MKALLSQLNPVVGDISGNMARARAARAEAAHANADILVLTELFIAGYPPEDLVLKPAFQDACRAAVETLARETADDGPAVIIGVPWLEAGRLYNACACLDDGRIIAVTRKVDLPNYGVFDEKRVFASGPLPDPVTLRGVKLGIAICEDIWTPAVTAHLKGQGADVLVVPNGSPFWKGKPQERLTIARSRVAETGLPMLYVNQVGGQDELVFDGGSFAMDAAGEVVAALPLFEEGTLAVDFSALKSPTHHKWETGHAATYAACVLGLRDYVEKSRFPAVVLGLSGGIDSALVAAMAVDALGPQRVKTLMLPYHYTASASLEDAKACALALGVAHEVVPIAPVIEGFTAALTSPLGSPPEGITAENLQSRARGTILMAVSNATGAMVLTTGNKSEMSVGYATLYGDMNGGFNPIKDLYKLEVYALARLRNGWQPRGALGPDGVVIPERIITRAPSAELRPDQTDQDSLPPYDILDAILEALVEDERPVAAIIAQGFDAAVVARVQHLLYAAEYKRRQAAPGVKVTRRTFGRDRRYPIVNRFREP